MKIRRHIYFSGRVQGVGFRYHAYYISKSLGLTGWVKNLSDGRVEMEVQGNAESIEIMVERLNKQRFIHIEEIDWKPIPLERDSSFEMLN